MKTALFTTFAPMSVTNESRQKLFAYSCSLQTDIVTTAIQQDEAGIADLCKTYNLQYLPKMKHFEIAGQRAIPLNDVLRLALENSDGADIIGWTTADTPVFSRAVSCITSLCAQVSHDDFIGYVRRHNMDYLPNGKLARFNFEDIQSDVLNWSLNFPGIDWFFWSRKTLEKMLVNFPPANAIAWGVERLFMGYMIQNIPYIYDLTSNIHIGHFQHEIRKELLPGQEDNFFSMKDPYLSYNRKYTKVKLGDVWRSLKPTYEYHGNGIVLLRMEKRNEL